MKGRENSKASYRFFMSERERDRWSCKQVDERATRRKRTLFTVLFIVSPLNSVPPRTFLNPTNVSDINVNSCTCFRNVCGFVYTPISRTIITSETIVSGACGSFLLLFYFFVNNSNYIFYLVSWNEFPSVV